LLRSIAAIALLFALVAPGAASAQPRFNFSFTPSAPNVEPQAAARRQQFAMPVIDYVAPDGSIPRRRGVVVGMEVGPQAMFGLGIFEGAPKRRIGAADPTRPERRSRRAAVGFSLKF